MEKQTKSQKVLNLIIIGIGIVGLWFISPMRANAETPVPEWALEHINAWLIIEGHSGYRTDVETEKRKFKVNGTDVVGGLQCGTSIKGKSCDIMATKCGEEFAGYTAFWYVLEIDGEKHNFAEAYWNDDPRITSAFCGS